MNTRKTPDFMLIGAPKAGTTTLYGKLRNHPDILLSEPKEPMYFSNPEVYARGQEWYHSLFDEALPSQICGECSTTYMRHPFIEEPNTLNPWPAISALEKTPKFIYAMRHPADRAFSHYVHHMRYGCTMTFEEAIQQNPIYLDCSRYAMQMNAFREHMPHAELLALSFDEVIHNRTGATYSIMKFLGVAPILPPDPHKSRMNRSDNREFFSKLMSNFPGWNIARKYISPKLKRNVMEFAMNSRLGRRIAKKTEVQPMKPETRRQIIDELEPDIRTAEELIGKELPHWRK